MEINQENRNCYATPAQREVLLDLLTNPLVEKHFFLTGGTALAVFYLNHRKSNDLDLFTVEPLQLENLDTWVKRMWPHDYLVTNKADHFLSVLIRDVKVDFVIDSLSSKQNRPTATFENNHTLHVDTLENIVSNKFCTLVSRTEPKDFVDFYCIQQGDEAFSFEIMYEAARHKEGIFDDPPTAAYHLENSLEFFRQNPELFPETRFAFDPAELITFYEKIISQIYGLAR